MGLTGNGSILIPQILSPLPLPLINFINVIGRLVLSLTPLSVANSVSFAFNPVEFISLRDTLRQLTSMIFFKIGNPSFDVIENLIKFKVDFGMIARKYWLLWKLLVAFSCLSFNTGSAMIQSCLSCVTTCTIEHRRIRIAWPNFSDLRCLGHMN